MSTPSIESRLFDILKQQFQVHLTLEGNVRTIFSGKFGSGKTTFLDLFFKAEQEQFIPITLHPVNYSIATNEDIFQYIKYDLLLELLPLVDISKLDSFDLGLPEKAYLLWHDQPSKVIEHAVSLIGSLGKLLHPSLDILDKVGEVTLKVKKSMDEHYNELQNKKDEHKVFDSFTTTIKEKSSSLYEDTVLTRLIEKLVAMVKSCNAEDAKPKKVIVVIEDLDRIDPEHIFRILNVFSAHFDSRHTRGENSFAIDTLVVVCDEDNVRNIFANRYGSNVDYSGYLDKFFSACIFHFNYAELARGYIGKLISNAKIRMADGHGVSDSVINTVLADSFLEFVLTTLFNHKYINLRSINRVLGSEIFYSPIDIRLPKQTIALYNYLILFELLIVIQICGGVGITQKYVSQLAMTSDYFLKRGKVVERLVALLIAKDTSPSDAGKLEFAMEKVRYTGEIVENEDGQKSIPQLLVIGAFGTADIEFVRTNHLFELIGAALSLIERHPELTLSGYYRKR